MPAVPGAGRHTALEPPHDDPAHSRLHATKERDDRRRQILAAVLDLDVVVDLVDPRRHCRTLTARAITSATVTSAIVDCTAISTFAQRANGSVSVGLNAVALVKLRYR